MLQKTFCREFWPAVQEVLQKKSKLDLMQMLDSHCMASVQAKKKSDQYLYQMLDDSDY